MGSKSIIPKIVFWGVLGILIRITYVLWVVGKYGRTQFSDFLYMHQLAGSLAAGNGFTIEGIRIFNQSVGYPAFLSVFYKLFGSDVWTALAMNIILGGVAVALVYVIVLRLFAGIELIQRRRVARFAALLAVIYPDSLLYCALVSAENLLIPLMLILVLSVMVTWKSDWLSGFVVGVVAAAACSVKAHVIFFCLTVPFIWYVVYQRVGVRTFAAIFAAIVFLLPWSLMNYHASGGYLVPFGAVAGEVMLDGTNPEARGKPTNQYHLAEDIESGKHPVELDRLRMKKAMQYIQDNPAWYAGLCFKKAVLSFSPARDFLFQFQDQDRFFGSFLSRWFPTMFNGFLLVGVIAGLVLVRSRPDMLVVGVGLFAAQLMLQVVFVAYPRYRFPFLFCLLPFCALWVLEAFGIIRSSAKIWKRHKISYEI